MNQNKKEEKRLNQNKKRKDTNYYLMGIQIKTENYSFTSTDNITLNMNLYKAKENIKNITILYFHGGGLLYGVRDDLPELYLNMFLEEGYDFLALDYPLAPESKIDVIMKSSYEEILYFLNNYNTIFNLESNKYLLFGRSAGSYLCFMMCHRLMNNNISLPMSIISLYGYTRLDDVSFHTPSNYYNKLSKIPDESITKIITDTPITYAPINARLSLYIKARQEGTWIRDICGSNNMSDYSVPKEQLTHCPPTILAAATQDPDVPYKMSKELLKLIPGSKLITLYEESHDFDRDVTNNTGKTVYEEIIKWLDLNCNK